MPKSTFFNLPEDKKERILETALGEFEEYTYNNASINRIVEKAEISKGSFYQYFEDKLDLFKYILDMAAGKKLEYLGHLMENMSQLGFFEIIRELYIGGIKFANENPRLAKISNEFLNSADDKLKEEIYKNNIPKSNALFEGLLMKGIESGELDPEIDIKLTAHIITSLSISIGDYFNKEVKSDDYMDIMDLVDKMLYIIKDGIKSKDKLVRNTRNSIEDRFY